MDIEHLQNECYRIASEHGWWDKKERNFGELIALIHSELSEALEEWRSNHACSEIYYHDDKPEGVPIELADAIIRIADMSEAFGIDLTEALEIKMAYNETRPYRHGGKIA